MVVLSYAVCMIPAVPDDAFNSSVGIYSIYLVPGGSLPCNNDNYQTGVFYSHQRHVVIEYQKG